MSNNTDTKVLKVLGCQGRQDRLVDLVLAERRLIPFEAKAPSQPPMSMWRPESLGGEQSSARRNNLSRPRNSRASLACGEGTAMAETRKLAAILAADVVGYSRLAGSDEDRTLARLRALRSDLIDPDHRRTSRSRSEADGRRGPH